MLMLCGGERLPVEATRVCGPSQVPPARSWPNSHIVSEVAWTSITCVLQVDLATTWGRMQFVFAFVHAIMCGSMLSFGPSKITVCAHRSLFTQAGSVARICTKP
ncbi:hypothetical protein IG631_07063 [Alternaria alternata]|nr:hypothetical protein IG631_07063 [Alternaria alternata]